MQLFYITSFRLSKLFLRQLIRIISIKLGIFLHQFFLTTKCCIFTPIFYAKNFTSITPFFHTDILTFFLQEKFSFFYTNNFWCKKLV